MDATLAEYYRLRRPDALASTEGDREVVLSMAIAGDYPAALDRIEHAVTEFGPWEFGPYALDPWFDPARDDPRFRALDEQYRRWLGTAAVSRTERCSGPCSGSRTKFAPTVTSQMSLIEELSAVMFSGSHRLYSAGLGGAAGRGLPADLEAPGWVIKVLPSPARSAFPSRCSSPGPSS
jgi:hypothetical protein